MKKTVKEALKLKGASPSTEGPQVSEYNGNAILVLNPNDRFKFQFGKAKAKMILDNIEAIKRFANS